MLTCNEEASLTSYVSDRRGQHSVFGVAG